MSEQAPEEERDLTEAEVLAVLGGVADRIGAQLVDGVPMPPAAAREVRERLIAILSADAGGAWLLAAAYQDGRETGAGEVRRADSRDRETDPAPDWSDVPSTGERRAIAREESACGRCSHARVCGLAREAAAMPESLVVIRRCASFAAALPPG